LSALERAFEAGLLCQQPQIACYTILIVNIVIKGRKLLIKNRIKIIKK
jgi:hypothetical protein